MRQLRSLADEGRVVMVVTHSVLALDLCDNVLVMAPGGWIAYFGPPAGVLARFGRTATIPRSSTRSTSRTSGTGSRCPSAASTLRSSPRSRHGCRHHHVSRSTKQLTTLIRRTTAVVMADRLLLTLLLVLPLVLGGLSRLVPGRISGSRWTRHRAG